MELFDALWALLGALYDVVVALVAVVVPWTPLIAWVAFWSLAVNWVNLRRVLLSGGWVGVLLIMLMAVLGWGSIAPPESGRHVMLGLTLSNFVGKTVYVTALAVIALLCGSMQLSGLCGSLVCFNDSPAEDPHDAHAHETAAAH
ncbi:MAG: hypothetical protein KF861_06735 [Planctomycetaceae bacterium]|nr:hypothetical protein [Planctomycetaceae bacterium]